MPIKQNGRRFHFEEWRDSHITKSKFIPTVDIRGYILKKETEKMY